MRTLAVILVVMSVGVCASAVDSPAPTARPAAALTPAAAGQLPAMSAAERAQLAADLTRRRDQLQALDRQLAQCIDGTVTPLPEACRAALAAQRNLIARQLIETLGGLAAVNGDFAKVLNPPEPDPTPATDSGG